MVDFTPVLQYFLHVCFHRQNLLPFDTYDLNLGAPITPEMNQIRWQSRYRLQHRDPLQAGLARHAKDGR
jgi:hypothetical protein